jgi:transposase
MKGVELYGQVRRAVYVEGLSRREAARRYGIDPRTVAKMLAFSVPPGYRRTGPPARPKPDALRVPSFKSTSRRVVHSIRPPSRSP